jgi:hypothetical protein
LPIVPSPNPALIAHKGNEDEININNFSLGDYHANAIADAIQHSHPNKLYLANNRINFDAAK